ncbi:MAG: pyrimidine 5'-nucleotidase [Paracoccaceae bacterium]
MLASNDFSHITTWVFDLDNTLYPPKTNLFGLIEVRMTTWVMQALNVDEQRANYLRTHYWKTYGTTLAGLMREHNVDPSPYLTDVHDIALDRLSPDPLLAQRIKSLPGRRIIYTNGTADYATKVVAARGLAGLFDVIYGVEDADFLPKPEFGAFDLVFGKDGFDRSRAVMFEDDARNLKVPHQMGLKTVLINQALELAPYIDRQGPDLSDFLGHILG